MNRFSNFAALLLCAVASHTMALQSDRSQPITIDADRAERDELAGTTTYSGKVEMAQGSMRINADQIVIYNKKDKVTKIIARGKPASYQQKPSEKAGKVVAKANVLEYRIDKETLRLLDGASLKQEGTSLSGNTIEYDVRKSVVKADSRDNQNDRVRMVIPPKALRSEEPKSGTQTPASEASSSSANSSAPSGARAPSDIDRQNEVTGIH
ncbi:MAG TPA: lipopolysaccharide transport periplasmic protein LptA [Marinagarivorans sp.]